MKQKLYIASPADRDAVITILARNGYTMRQGREPKPGSRTVKRGYVEYWPQDPATEGKDEA